MITLDTIRQRLAEDKKKPSRVATWEEIEYLLGLVDALQADLADALAEVDTLNRIIAALSRPAGGPEL